ncbi:unnamed protein product [Rhizopus stolonifer]
MSTVNVFYLDKKEQSHYLKVQRQAFKLDFLVYNTNTDTHYGADSFFFLLLLLKSYKFFLSYSKSGKSSNRDIPKEVVLNSIDQAKGYSMLFTKGARGVAILAPKMAMIWSTKRTQYLVPEVSWGSRNSIFHLRVFY